MTNKKKLAIIGGSYLQLPAVETAQRLGYEVHCFSWVDGAICAKVADFFYPISIVEKEDILAICEKVGIDGVMSIASDTAVLTVNYVAEKMGLIGNPDAFSQTCTDKYLMRKCFIANGCPSPHFAVTGDGGELDIKDFKFPLIVKPTDRSGSRGVEKIETESELAGAIIRAEKEAFSHKAIVEEFIEGCEVSVESISYEGRHHILQITDKVTTGAPYFVELEHHQPSALSADIQSRIREIVLKALDALHVCCGASHSELKITDSGEIYIIEIGARMGGDFIGSHLVRLSTGYDFLEATVRVAMGNFIQPGPLEQKHSGVYFLCKETEHLKPIFENSGNYPEIVESDITDPTLRDIKCSGDRSGYFIYQSDKKFLHYEQ